MPAARRAGRRARRACMYDTYDGEGDRDGQFMRVLSTPFMLACVTLPRLVAGAGSTAIGGSLLVWVAGSHSKTGALGWSSGAQSSRCVDALFVLI